jgi:hypothetical protein
MFIQRDITKLPIIRTVSFAASSTAFDKHSDLDLRIRASSIEGQAHEPLNMAAHSARGNYASPPLDDDDLIDPDDGSSSSLCISEAELY